MPTKAPKKWQLNAKAVRLLRRVEKHILAEPLRYSQAIWGGSDSLSPCGTAACIAGWCDILKRGEPDRAVLTRWNYRIRETEGFINNVPRRAARALGVPLGRVFSQDCSLFSGCPEEDWPEPFKEQWLDSEALSSAADRHGEQAKIAVARIEWFIKTGE